MMMTMTMMMMMMMMMMTTTTMTTTMMMMIFILAHSVIARRFTLGPTAARLKASGSRTNAPTAGPPLQELLRHHRQLHVTKHAAGACIPTPTVAATAASGHAARSTAGVSILAGLRHSNNLILFLKVRGFGLTAVGTTASGGTM
jgi:hypothetical protein